MSKSKYLNNFDEYINKKSFDDWFIDDLFFSYKDGEVDDEIALIIRKYFSTNYKLIVVDDSDAQLLLDCYDSNYNVLLRAILDFLLANSCYREKSNLVEDCKEYIGLYFDKILEIKGGMPTHNFERLLRWTTYKYPSEKKEIGNLIFKNIILKKYKTFRYFSLSGHILNEKDLFSVMDKEQYITILNTHYVVKVEQSEVYLYLDIYNSYLRFLKKVDKANYNIFLKKYVDFVFANMTLIDSHTKQVELQRVRQYMDLLKTYSDGEYDVLDKELERVNKEQLKELKTITINLPKEENERIRTFIQDNENFYKSLNSVEKILHLLNDTAPISLTDVKRQLENKEKRPLGLFKENILDSDGRIINYDELNENQEMSLKATQHIGIVIQLFFDMVFNPFYRTFKMDSEAESFINKVMSNNELVDSERIGLLSKLFISFFSFDFEHSVFDIVLELEESLRYYFKSQGLNIIKRNCGREFIGLNNIFNDFAKNSFRDKLLERIDENFYFTLKWFLTDEYGFDLRDKISHRLKTQNLYNTTFAIYASLQVFRLYCGFEKDE